MLVFSRSKALYGFTLAELLIALAILGIIAVFTIPKLLQVQHDKRMNAVTRETMAALTSALSAHRYKGKLNADTQLSDLLPYLNYIRLEDVTSPDCFMDAAGGNPILIPCSDQLVNDISLVRLHNNALLMIANFIKFGGATSSNGIPILLDPDGVWTGRGDSIWLVLYFNGRITSYEHCMPTTNYSANGSTSTPCTTPMPAWTKDPPWFRGD